VALKALLPEKSSELGNSKAFNATPQATVPDVSPPSS